MEIERVQSLEEMLGSGSKRLEKKGL